MISESCSGRGMVIAALAVRATTVMGIIPKNH